MHFPPIKLFSSLLLLFFAQLSWAQTWQPQFVPLKVLPYPDYHYDLPEYLAQYTYAFYERQRSCQADYGFFYFRVNGKGKVDSIRVEGILGSEVTDQIKKNIYATEGNWFLPQGTKPEATCWFIFLYGAFGRQKNCSEEQNRLFKVLSDYRNAYSTLSKRTETPRGILLRPYWRDPMAEK